MQTRLGFGHRNCCSSASLPRSAVRAQALSIKAPPQVCMPHSVLYPPSTGPPPSAAIGCIQEEDSQGCAGTLHAFTHALARAQHKLNYVHLVDGGSTPTSGQVRALAIIYDALTGTDPRISLVPLLPSAGWSAGAVAVSLPQPVTLALPCQGTAPTGPLQGPAQLLLQAIAAATGSLPELVHLDVRQEVGAEELAADVHMPEVIMVPSPGAASQGGPEQQQQQQGVQGGAQGGVDEHQQDDRWSRKLCFKRLALGGTFDRLHCGHRLLLAAAALLAEETAYVGVTAERLLANKNHAELLESFEARRSAAVDYMRAVRPSLNVVAGALVDPQAPTQAELDPTMEAIVVSRETLSGAEKINAGRVSRGFQPLVIVVVPVIGGKDPSNKLSSSQLRAQDAQALAKAAS